MLSASDEGTITPPDKPVMPARCSKSVRCSGEISAAQQVVAESGAVVLGTTFVGLLTGGQPGILLLGLPAFDIDVALLGFDGAVGLLVLRKQRIPPLLLLGGHLATVGRRAQLVDPCENSSAALFKGFQFAHKSRY